MTITLETYRQPLAIFLRIGRWEAFAQRETAPAAYGFTRPGPGEMVIDLPGLSIAMTTHARRRAAAG